MHAVKSVLADQNTSIGIFVRGRGTELRNNRVLDTGGSTVDLDSYGVFLAGPGNNVIDNQVSTITATNTGNAYGLYIGIADSSIISNNQLSEAVATGSGISYGVFISSSNDVVARHNLITSADNGIYYISSTGLYGRNYTGNVTTPFTDGTAAGSTNHSIP